MTTKLLNKLHEFAILRGWYKDVTYGCPLNIIRTVFGTYAFEGIYIMRSLGSLISEIREWEFMVDWNEDGNYPEAPKISEEEMREAWDILESKAGRYGE